MEAGASGYLVKNILGDKLIMAIRLVRDGESVFSNEIKNKLLKHALRYPSTPSSIPVVGDRLSVRELEIFQLAAKGMSNKEISQQLNLNLRTVKSHFVNIFSKLNANSRTEAVMIGLRLGLISIDDIS
jgi:DNA-binding NarL/FixJ family response regulator